MPEREWKLGEDLVTSDNLLDGLTFDDLILAVHHNSRVITPEAVRKELREMLEGRKQDMMFLLEKNMDAIMAEARKGRAIEFLGGLDDVARFVPFPVETIRMKLKDDPHLNNTAMSKWDAASGFVCRGIDCKFIGGGILELYRQHGINAASNSDGVCILKEAARRLVAREEVAK